MKTPTQTNWHALPAEAATTLLQSDPSNGLAMVEVEARLRQFKARGWSLQRETKPRWAESPG